ncbi:MAG: glycosyltransferase [Candidatus Zixiibacteriota bacterium]
MTAGSGLQAYAEVVGEKAIDYLRQVARPLQGKTVVHVNSTRTGGGVAEILAWLVPLKRELGIDAHWEVITGSDGFFQATKGFHNALQGTAAGIDESLLEKYILTNRENAARLAPKLCEADFVFIHDPQPAPLLSFLPERKGAWIWRCHIDASRPYPPVWEYLRERLVGYDASIFSLANFAQSLPHPQYIIPPSIDPLSDKNRQIDGREIADIRQRFNLDPDRPLLLQVSRYDRFKDPLGVIVAYRLTRNYHPAQLVLAGGAADDDPEGSAVLEAVRREAAADEDIHVLNLPPDSHRAINALQRASEIVLQKSTREGFGLTVTEALWKGKPVIGGNTGGITLQVVDYHTGFLVDTPEGAAFRLRYLLTRPNRVSKMGETARRFVLDHFLLTRQLRDYLTLMLGLWQGSRSHIDL